MNTYESIPSMPDYTWLLGKEVLYKEKSATVIAVRRKNKGLDTEVVIHRGGATLFWTMTKKLATQDRELGPVVANFDDYIGKTCNIVAIRLLMSNEKMSTFSLDWPE